MSEAPVPGDEGPKGHSRRSFLQTSGGIATGIAVTVLPSGVVALAAPGAADAKAQAAEAQGDVPEDAVMAYVHDAKNGVVTVVSGTEERTYRDHKLVKHLLDAANATKA